MNDSHKNQAIPAAIGRVEHPAISTTLLDLGIIRDESDNQTRSEMLLPV